MADSKKYWKESIGVVQKKPRRPAAAATVPKPDEQAEDAHEPLDEVDRATGAEDAETADSHPTETDPTAPVGLSTSKRDVATRAALAPVGELLDSLPVGSLDLPRQVADKLWPDPTALEIRHITKIAENWRAVRHESRRFALLKAIVARQRMASLLGTRHLILGDSLRLEARSREWNRLAAAVEEAQARLSSSNARGVEEEVFKAALAILPAPRLLRSESALCSALSGLLDSVRTFLKDASSQGGRPLAVHVVPEAEPLIEQIRTGEFEPESLVFFEVSSALLLVHQDLGGAQRDAIERDRELLRIVKGKLERVIEVQMSARVRGDPTKMSRLAAWRRRISEASSRIDEWLTNPRPAAASSDGESGEAADSEALLRERLREVREEATGDVADGEEPPQRRGWKRWLTFGLGVVVAACLLAAHLLLPPRIPTTPRVHPEDFAEALPLGAADGAGALLVAMADPMWDEMNTDERRRAAIRLMTAAERRGFPAGLLMAADGTPLASWAPGQTPTLRRSPARTDIAGSPKLAAGAGLGTEDARSYVLLR